jgi:serine/threonine protein kinase
MTGITLNQYRLAERIGAGAMGEVFRAHDTRLNRDVAVKVLPREFAADGDRLRRFEQETRTLASLNHPNVLTIHDAGLHEGAPYLVSELLQGHNLRETMNGAALPRRRAVDYSLQIARGLAAAHGKDIIHRDLKPENVFISADGRVKVLDFGLAKLSDPTPAMPGPDAVTFAPHATAPGVVLGTPAYMSPEQVRGQSADQRADLFAFGSVFYEMLTGMRAFRGDTAVEVMHAILNEEPQELSTLKPDLPPALVRIVNRCLEKDSARRFQSADDLGFALEMLEGASSTRLAAVTATRRRSRWPVPIALAAIALAALTAWAPWKSAVPRDATLAASSWVEVTPPPRGFSHFPSPSISPDGRQVAFYAMTSEGSIGLFVRSLDEPKPRLLFTPPGAQMDGLPPSWSPDGRSLAVFHDKLQRIDLAGGKPLDLADASNPRGATWNAAGDIIFVPAATKCAYRIPASGGDRQPVPGLLGEESTDVHWPCFLPDGRHYLAETKEGVVVASLDSPDVKKVSAVHSRAQFANGYLFFGDKTSLFAQQFDLDKLSLFGEPVRIADDLGVGFGSNSAYSFSVSASGTLVYWSGHQEPITQLTWFSRAGERLSTVGEPGEYAGFSRAPAGGKTILECHIAKENRDGLWLWDESAGVGSVFETGLDSKIDGGTPFWAPDGNKILFATWPGLAIKTPSAGETRIVAPDLQCWLTDVSPDGRSALVAVEDRDTLGDIWIVPLTDDQKPKPLLTGKYNESSARFSPDGKWVAYISDEIELWHFEVYVRSLTQPGQRFRVSTNGGRLPEWSPDGKELFFVAGESGPWGGDGVLSAVDVKLTADHFEASKPKALFPVKVGHEMFRRQYQPSPDGQRFIVNARSDDPGPPSLTVLLNWPARVHTK